MEGNNPNTTDTPNPIPVPTPSQPVGGTGESNKLVIWFAAGLVAIAILVGGTYLFLSQQQTAVPAVKPVVSQTPAPVVQQNLEEDLDSINIEGSVDSDLSAIDRDLQQL